MKTITVGGKTIELHAVKGVVLDSSKNMETKVSGSGGGYTFNGRGSTRPVRISSKTTIHDQFFLKDDQGIEHSFQLQDFDLACREGNTLVVISAIKQGGNGGPYVAVINHTTGKINYNSNAMKKAFGPNMIILGGIFLGVCLVGFSIWHSGFFTFLFFLFLGMLAYAAIVTSNNVKTAKGLISPTDF